LSKSAITEVFTSFVHKRGRQKRNKHHSISGTD